MGYTILAGTLDRGGKGACFVDTVTDWAFGPVFHSVKEAHAFAEWIDCDPRTMKESALEAKLHAFRSIHPPKASRRTCAIQEPRKRKKLT